MADTAQRPDFANYPRIPRANYVSKQFAHLEMEQLWPRTWQVACREEEIPKPGDYVTYDIGKDSIIVVRSASGSVNAFFNTCPHRGRALTEGCGHVGRLRCAFHGWTFDLDGRNVAVQDRKDWAGALSDEEASLRKVQTGTWGGFVFITMQAQPEPLLDYLRPLTENLDPFEYENMRYRWYLTLDIACNWKIALEAFMEGYHVAATHTQLLPHQGDDYTQSYAHGRHAHFGYWRQEAMIGSPSPRLKMEVPRDNRVGVVRFFDMMEEQLGAIFTDRGAAAARTILDTLPPDIDAMSAFGAAVEAGRAAAEAEGCGYPPNLSYEHLAKAGTGWNIFPNCMTLPWFDGAIWYRARPHPDDPARCIFDIWSLKRYAPGQEPPLERRSSSDAAGESFGMIVDQDVSNMRALQKGLASRGVDYLNPSPVQEVVVSNFHRVIESYVAGGDGA
jgi:nitrite reductase/ring-hydroxylating ferredoxin subunit